MSRDPGYGWRVIRLILRILETRSSLSHSALTVDLMLKSRDVAYSFGETDGVRLEYTTYRRAAASTRKNGKWFERW